MANPDSNLYSTSENNPNGNLEKQGYLTPDIEEEKPYSIDPRATLERVRKELKKSRSKLEEIVPKDPLRKYKFARALYELCEKHKEDSEPRKL